MRSGLGGQDLPISGLESPLIAGLGFGPGQQVAEEAPRPSPPVPVEDATEYSGYDRAQAVALAEQAFGIEHPAWVAPQNQGSGTISKYVGSHMAEELLPDGQHVLVASSLPLRSAVGSGQEKPVSLGLSSTGSGYMPANPVVPVVLGKTPGEGVSFQFGLRMAPVGRAAPEAPVVVGDSVFYPGTAKATDFMLEARPLGIEASWQLLSAESSGENALSFALPQGADLVMSNTVHGAAEVRLEGETLLLIMPASAREANGAELPVSYTVSGSTLTTHVDLAGNVDFPVDVDPVVWQKYGGSSGFWGAGEWTTAASQPGVAKFLGGAGNAGIGAEIVAEAPGRSWASWGLYAPGFKAGEGALTRMDVTGMMHLAEENKSNVEAGIVGAENSVLPDTSYSYDGENLADTRKGMMLTSEKFEGRDVAFCAHEEEGGYDGGSKPLCNETVGGEYWRFTIDTWEQQRYWQYEMIEGNIARFIDTSKIEAKPATASEVGGQPNVLSGSGEKWLGPNNGALEAIGSDPAFGVANMKVTIEAGGKSSSVAYNYANEGGCDEPHGIRCSPTENSVLSYNNFPVGMPNGEDKIKIEAGDPAGLTAIWSSTVLVDNTPPTKPVVTGADVHEKLVNITEGPAGDQITVEAHDGEGSIRSAGIKHLGVWIDGIQHGGYEGSCSPGPCTAKATWTLNGRELGAGTHSLVVKALDNADNESEEKYELDVHAASPVAMGPGSVNLQSGDLALESTDVNLKDAAGALALTQHYDSLNVNEGAEGPLGPQWTIGLGQLAALEVVGEENENVEKAEAVIVAGPEGLSYFKAKGSNNEFEGSPNQPELTLKLAANHREFTLENTKTGNSTVFTHPKGAKQWMPTISKAPGKTNALTDSYQSIEVEKGHFIVEPTEELAPHGEATCPAEREKLLEDEHTQARACRALYFYYGSEKATQSEASGEAQSQWGWYPNRLTQVVAVTWSTSTNKMEETAVAEFSYDHHGRLRAEWDPRIKPTLETIYGYDQEGHVTSLTPPGQQPWTFIYGTTSWDSSSGRILKITRARPKTGASEAEVEKRLSEEMQPLSNNEKPALSGTAEVGVRMTVSNDKWEGMPVVYRYQWSRCDSGPTECEVIAGATNQNYTPQSADVGHVLVGKVEAIDADNAVAASTNQSATVVSGEGHGTAGTQEPPQPGMAIEYDVPISGATAPYEMSKKEVETWGQKDVPAEAAEVFAEEHVQGWPASGHTGATVFYVDDEAQTVNAITPSGGVTTAEYEDGKITRTLSAANRARALKEANPAEAAKELSTVSTYNGEGQLSEVTGPQHKIRLSLDNEEEVSARNHVRYYYDEGAPDNSKGEPEKDDLVTKTTDGALLANGQEKDLRATLTGYAGQEGLGWELHAPTSTTVEPGGADLVSNTVYNRETGDVVETQAPGSHLGPVSYVNEWGSKGSGSGQFSVPRGGLATNSAGDIYVSDTENSRVEEFTPDGVFIRQWGSRGTGNGQFTQTSGLAVAPNGDVYVSDDDQDRIQWFTGEGAYLGQFATSSSGDGITVEKSGKLLVTNDVHNCVEEYSSEGKLERSFGSEGEGKLNRPSDVAVDPNGDIVVDDEGAVKMEEFTSEGKFIRSFGSQGRGNGQFSGDPWAITIGPEGYIWVADTDNNRIEAFSFTGEYEFQFGKPGGLHGDTESPVVVTISGDFAYVLIEGEGHPSLEKWALNNPAVHDTKTVYYSPGTEAGVAECENRPQWAGLICRSAPVAQPKDSSPEPKGQELPELPIVTTEYNMWLAPVKTTEKIGNKSRTETTSYEGERIKSQATEATASDEALPAVNDKYSETLGMLVEQSTKTGSETKAITQKLNTLGQLESYTDAEGNATTYSYDQYGRPTEINYDASKLDAMEAKERIRYEETTGQIEELEDLGGEGTYDKRGAGTFKATYGPEGELATETYPNNMTATYGYNSIGEGTALTYTKNNHCSGSECEWFKDARTPSIHGETLFQQSTLASTYYNYQQPSGLSEARETPAGEGCTRRLYEYNEEGDRTTEATHNPESGGHCSAEASQTELHTYDEANRLIDEGVQYEELGNITKLPAADAGGKYSLSTTYYSDGQVQSQTQNQITNEYLLDPEGRTRQTKTSQELTTTAVQIAHYPGPGASAPSWTYNETNSSITRDIAAFGGLVAVEEAAKEPALQIRDLQGNIIGTVSLNETEGKPQTLERTTEYGVPTKEKPEDKYNWLGTTGITSNLPSGAIVQDGTTYVPQLGAPLEAEGTPVPAEPHTVVPYVITTSPTWFAYGEAWTPTPETPPGNLPSPTGEETQCTGTAACAARYKKRVKAKCKLQTGIAILKGEVLAVAMGSCGGAVIPSRSQSKVCLYGTDTSGYDPGPYQGWKECGYNIGNNDTYRYAAVKAGCASYTSYTVWGWFWMPGWPKGETSNEEREWQCKAGASPFQAWEEPIYFTVEIFEGIAQLMDEPD